MSAPALAPSDPVPADFDVLEVFTALYVAAEQVESLRLDETGTDAVTQAGLVKVLRGGNLPAATIRERDLLDALTTEPQSLSRIGDELDGAARALSRIAEELPQIEFAPQPGSRPSMVWLTTPTIPPADDATILEGIPDPPAVVPIATLAASLGVDAGALSRYLSGRESVFVGERVAGLVVGRLSAT